ncbi:hypothetical protein GYA54_01910, partial [Candidatus Kuenenbacteria bacterium]|nr:hypothetical protein [Candidatus Kuenenbacteria bacterium]
YLVDNPYAAPNAIDAKDTTNQPTELTTWEAWWTTNKLLLGLAALALVCAIIYGAFRLTRKPFINQPPDFWSATEEEVSAAAHEALLPTAGQGFQFIGPVQRGILNGEQTGFYRGGGRQKEHFHNEPGFRARIRTSAGKEFMVHCKWACFNPCWGIEGAEFKGTFTPIGGSTQSVPEISDDTADKIGKAIGTGKEVFDEEILPAEEPISTPVTTDEPTAEAGAAAEPEKPATAESAKQVTEPLVVKGAAEIEITSGRIKVIGGEINLTFAQLKELRPAGKSGKEE